MHPEQHTELEDLSTVQHNLRTSAKGSKDAYDVSISLTFTVLEEKAPDGYMWSGVKSTRKQLTSQARSFLCPETLENNGEEC